MLKWTISLVADKVGAKDITFEIQSGFHEQAYNLLLFGTNYEYIWKRRENELLH